MELFLGCRTLIRRRLLKPPAKQDNVHETENQHKQICVPVKSLSFRSCSGDYLTFTHAGFTRKKTHGNLIIIRYERLDLCDHTELYSPSIGENKSMVHRIMRNSHVDYRDLLVPCPAARRRFVGTHFRCQSSDENCETVPS